MQAAGKRTDLVGEPLAAWNDTPTRRAIVDFVEMVTDRDGFPPEERVAVFDNDGTLWCEKPMPIELGLHPPAPRRDGRRRTRRCASSSPGRPPTRRTTPGWASVITKHYHGDDSDVKVLMGGILQAFAGMTVDEYSVEPATFLHEGAAPDARSYLRDCGYQPMVELLRYLEANGFTIYIASGGDRDFMRADHAGDLRHPARARHRQLERAARTRTTRTAARWRLPGGAGRVRRRSGQAGAHLEPHRPAARSWPVGNSNGDIPMLRFAGAPRGRRCACWSPRRRRARVRLRGRRRAVARAAGDGWTVVSMKNDWAEVFAGLIGAWQDGGVGLAEAVVSVAAHVDLGRLAEHVARQHPPGERNQRQPEVENGEVEAAHSRHRAVDRHPVERHRANPRQVPTTRASRRPGTIAIACSASRVTPDSVISFASVDCSRKPPTM